MTGLTSNPTIFEQAIKNSSAYDAAITEKLALGKSGEELFFELALDDLTKAADLFRPDLRSDQRHGRLGVARSVAAARERYRGNHRGRHGLFASAARPNLMIKIPGTAEGLPAIEEAIFAGIPINVTLLFSREHYFAAAEAFLRGIERRIDAGLKPEVASVASVFISRWDSAVAATATETLRNQLGIAMAKRTYKAYRSLLSSPRWQRVYNAGAAAPETPVGQHGHEGSKSVGCPLHQGAGRTVHRQHNPRGDVERARGSRRAVRAPAGQWRELRGGTGPVCRRRSGPPGPRRPAAGRGRCFVRKIVALADGGHRLEERDAHDSDVDAAVKEQ